MPQINRIRVNNVKYNFGTQSYEDFCMRFSCKNTIYDLANGGGKSLLMLLLLQNLIPNCTLDEKQPIEKLFRKNSGNTVIHSLIEWKLDECYVREQYRFMTTGFCARKALSSGDEEGGSASVEYFNYCIFYRKFGDNDIRNLPLVQNGEKITYNGLKAYLRDLEKKDPGVEVHIFEGKGEYQNFISKYGLYESEWEMIRGINKTEGHVRAYFENNYRTSRKVVEDLLIEEIIQKAFNNRMGTQGDEDTMAKTLMEIKGQLVELARKHSQMDRFDRQAEAFDRLVGNLDRFADLYRDKSRYEKAIKEMCLASRAAYDRQQERARENTGLIEEARDRVLTENRLIQTAKVMEEEENYQRVAKQCEEADKKRMEAEKKCAAARNHLRQQEAANDYADYLKAGRAVQQAQQALDNRLRDHGDILAELSDLAWAKERRDKSVREALQQELKELEDLKLQAGLKKEQTKQESEEFRINYARLEQRVQMLEELVQDKEKQLLELLSADTVLVPEEAQRLLEDVTGQCESCQREAVRLESALSDRKKQVDALKLTAARSEALIDSIDERIAELDRNGEVLQEDSNRFYELAKIYGENDPDKLVTKIMSTCRDLDSSLEVLGRELDRARTRREAVKNGGYVFDGEQYGKVKRYLESAYGDDVVDGITWFATLDKGQKRDLRKRLPFVEYGIIIKNDFERILHDESLQAFAGSSYLVPVISENVIYDTKLEVNSERIVYGTWNLDFLYDGEKRDVLVRSIDEEIAENELALERGRDKRQIIWADYIACLTYNVLMKRQGNAAEAQKELLSSDRSRLDEERQNAAEKLATEEKACEELNRSIANLQEKIEKLTERKAEIERICVLKNQIDALYRDKKAVESDGSIQEKYMEDAKAAEAQAEVAYNNIAEVLHNKSYELKKLNEVWEEFARFYRQDDGTDENAEKSGADGERARQRQLLMELPMEDLENRFYGLKEVYEKKSFDAADKKALVESFRQAMDKAAASIEYRQMTLEEVKGRYESGLVECAPAKLRELKAQERKLEERAEEVLREYDSCLAMKNRIEGGMEHAKNQIIERFGAYEPFACQSCQGFIAQHRALLDEAKQQIKDLEGQSKACDEEVKRLAIINKDLERIAANAGIDLKDAEQAADRSETGFLTGADFEAYEQTAGELNALQRRESKLKEEFSREKLLLTDRLNALEAFELAQEVKNSLNAPANVDDTAELKNNIRETVEYIMLEKERIEGSIQSMERIKENFENRCIQTCESIRAELERLPKMSVITLDDERISMIRLSVPYVREEQIKERMSSYIDETVTGAESFSNPEERLKYIRVRLAWKKLFSVIVTDMNGIRVELYKRERLKDQSRYLPYEEAVGSTGQSQGIYIQFFIAIIHYISSVNAAEGQAGVLGKTIFIDNPFGAAKDIYIWEPIFKLLATNHVQLIVPARGATPAITGRFDVNYILGQKLVGNRQQTVVVDYHSQIQQEMAEYVKMDYEQAKLDL